MSERTLQEHDIGSDSLATGIGFTMLLMVGQRVVGLLRTILFCRLLPEAELGQWSLVFSFVALFALMTVLGITGSFGRYVEHYLQRGQVQRFLIRTAFAVALLACLVLSAIWLLRDTVAWCVLGSAQQTSLMLPACFTLAAAIVYNYFVETLVALRRIRAGSTMELISSWTFAFLGISLLLFTDLGSTGVILSFAAGNLFASLFAIRILTTLWSRLPQSQTTFSSRKLWQKLAPYAIGLWMINVITNLFDLVDRYMIVHFTRIPAAEAQGLVGQYFSSMAFPLLMVGVSTTMAHLVMPYLSADWESGRSTDVSQRLNLALKMLAVVLCVGSACMVLVAPPLFHALFDGKYDLGLNVLPWAVYFCFLKGVSAMAYNYLFCLERTRLSCLSVVIGLVANILLNACLLPIWGLLGAALATTIGCAINLALILWFSRRLGFALDYRLLVILPLPLLFCCGTISTTLTAMLLLAATARSTLVFSVHERGVMDTALQQVARKLLPGQPQDVDGQLA